MILAFLLTVSASVELNLSLYKNNYYYKQLTSSQWPFYEALEYWLINDELKTGTCRMRLDSNNITLTKVAIRNLASYALGVDTRLLQQFRSAQAAWRYDHPEVFYVDFGKIEMCVVREPKEAYSITYGAISVDSFLIKQCHGEGVLDRQLKEYNKAVQKMVDSAKDKKTMREKVTAIHDYIANVNAYTYPYQAPNSTVTAFLNTTYGPLIYGMSVCGGYSSAFKVGMDKLGIESILIPGSATNSINLTELHQWNLVHLTENEDSWYAVDVTFDDTSNSKKYLMVNDDVIHDSHIADDNLDNSGVIFFFPTVYYEGINDWTTEIDVDKSLLVRYQNLSYNQLESMGYIWTYRYVYGSNKESLKIQEWKDYKKYLNGKYLDFDYQIHNTEASAVAGVQCGLVLVDVYNKLDDIKNGIVTYKNISESDVIRMSPWFISNKAISIADFLARPTITLVTPYLYPYWPGNEYDFRFTFSDILTPDISKGIESFDGITMNVSAISNSDNDGTEENKKKVGAEALKKSLWRNLRVLEDNKTIAFTFKSSGSYAHDSVRYFFNFHGIVSAITYLPPMSANILAEYRPNYGAQSECPKLWNNMYSVAGRPVLIADSNLDETDFTFEEDGKTQLLKGATTNDIALVATRRNGTGLDADNSAKFSALFDIDLKVYCKKHIKPGVGTKLTIQMPFPEGFDPADNADVEFEILHFYENGTIKERNTWEI